VWWNIEVIIVTHIQPSKDSHPVAAWICHQCRNRHALHTRRDRGASFKLH
jgi:hypothetical protein